VVGDDDVEKATLGVNARGFERPRTWRERGGVSARLLEEIATHGSPRTVVASRRFSAAWREDYVANVAQGHDQRDGACSLLLNWAEERLTSSTGTSTRAS